jgi:YVTN family beta-propeller protein
MGSRRVIVVLLCAIFGVGAVAPGAVAAQGPTAQESAKKRKAKKQRKGKQQAKKEPKAKAKRPTRKRKKVARAPATRQILVVGNNWDGTADVVDLQTLRPVKRLNIIPDREQRMAEIQADPVRLGLFLGVRALIGEGHDQFVDDAFTSPDGRVLYVSRPSFADVVSIDLGSGRIVWRTPVEGARSDHMAISPDGSKVLVSASLAKKVHVIDTATGRIVANIPSGDSPHESNYTSDGKLIYHASIGSVYTPLDDYAFDAAKGERVFEVIDAKTFEVKKRLDIGQILRTYGMPGMSSAVRPMAIAPGDDKVFFQLSFLHGFVEFDLAKERPLRIAQLPVAPDVRLLPREAYLLDSAHHGLAIAPDGAKLCVAGTMSDYAAITRTSDFATTIAARGSKPYWSTNSEDGKRCFISFSGDDRVAVVDYATAKEVASIPVGDHPQRMRTGRIREEFLR